MSLTTRGTGAAAAAAAAAAASTSAAASSSSDASNTRRYFSPVAVSRETNRRVRRLKLCLHRRGRTRQTTTPPPPPPPQQSEPFGDDFVPFPFPFFSVAGRRGDDVATAEKNEDDDEEEEEEGESVDDYVARKTREFNEGTRTRPRDPDTWLRYAEFQSQALALTNHAAAGGYLSGGAGAGGGGVKRRKAAEVTHATEKRRAILSRGLSHNPESEVLMLALMREEARLEDAATLKGRWRQILGQHADKPALWRAYIAQVSECVSE